MYEAVTARPAYKAHRPVSRHPWPSGMLAYFSYMADAPAAEADRFPHRATSTPTVIPGPSHCRAAKRRRSVPCLAHPARRFDDTRADRGSGICCINSVRRPRMRETEQQEPSSSLQTRSIFSSITGSVNAMRAPSPGHASSALVRPSWGVLQPLVGSRVPTGRGCAVLGVAAGDDDTLAIWRRLQHLREYAQTLVTPRSRGRAPSRAASIWIGDDSRE